MTSPELDQVTDSTLAELQRDFDEAHAAFSQAAANREACEKKRSDVARQRSILTAEYKKVTRSLSGLLDEALNAVEEGSNGADASALIGARQSAGLLKLAIQRHAAFAGATAERETLLAKIAETEGQRACEYARLRLHEAKVAASLAAAAELDGAIEINGAGPVTTQLQYLIAGCDETLRQLRQQLRDRDSSTLEAQNTFKEASLRWTN